MKRCLHNLRHVGALVLCAALFLAALNFLDLLTFVLFGFAQ